MFSKLLIFIRGAQAIMVLADADIREEKLDSQQALNQASVSFSNIAGLDDEIAVMKEVVELPLLHGELFATLGVRPPKGVLLHGPSGTGKSLLALATATHCGVNLFSVCGTETLSKYVGESESKVRCIFYYL